MPGLRKALAGAGATVGAGLAALTWSLFEARRPVLRRVEARCLAAHEEPLRVLHISDLHLTARTSARVRWVRALARLAPDMVVNTGDNLSFANGLEPLREALEPLKAFPGAFVMGDHDYHSTVFKPPTRYLRKDPRTADSPEDRAALGVLPWEDVRDLQAESWVDLGNARGVVTVKGRSIELVGVDDPHADNDRFPAEAPKVSGTADGARPMLSSSGLPFRMGLAHAPYQRVLAAMLEDGVDLALAGHTHGGQLCVPGFGALVTNCDIDRARASGLSSWPEAVPGGHLVEGPAPDGSLLLHVSAGLGTSPFTPVRLACPPEATLLTLLPVEG